jgi:hypothetical protein
VRHSCDLQHYFCRFAASSLPQKYPIDIIDNAPAPSYSCQQAPTIDIYEGNFVLNLLQRMLNEKFKDVKDPSQLPTLNSDPTIDCTKYKHTLDDDVTSMDAWMKEAIGVLPAIACRHRAPG